MGGQQHSGEAIDLSHYGDSMFLAIVPALTAGIFAVACVFLKHALEQSSKLSDATDKQSDSSNIKRRVRSMMKFILGGVWAIVGMVIAISSQLLTATQFQAPDKDVGLASWLDRINSFLFWYVVPPLGLLGLLISAIGVYWNYSRIFIEDE
jgi:hypothetical protein